MPTKSKTLAAKPPFVKQLRFWEITTEVNHSFTCFAGETHKERDDHKYATKPAPLDFDLLWDILEKIKQALDDNVDFITVSVEPDGAGGNYITGVVPPIEHKPPSAGATRAAGIRTSATKKNGRKKKPATSKPRKSKPRKSKGSK